MSVCPSSWNNSTPTGRILMKLAIWAFLEYLLRKFKFNQNPTRITDTLHENVFTFMTISRWILLRMRNVLDKSCRENQNTHFTLSYVFPKIAPFMRYVEKYDKAWGPQMTSQYGVYAWHAGWARLHARTRMHKPARFRTHIIMQYVLLFHETNDSRTCVNVTLIRTLPVLCLLCVV